MIRKISALLVFAFLLAGCNTLSGAGKDVERAGEKIQNQAERNR